MKNASGIFPISASPPCAIWRRFGAFSFEKKRLSVKRRPQGEENAIFGTFQKVPKITISPPPTATPSLSGVFAPRSRLLFLYGIGKFSEADDNKKPLDILPPARAVVECANCCIVPHRGRVSKGRGAVCYFSKIRNGF